MCSSTSAYCRTSSCSFAVRVCRAFALGKRIQPPLTTMGNGILLQADSLHFAFVRVEDLIHRLADSIDPIVVSAFWLHASGGRSAASALDRFRWVLLDTEY